MAEQDRRAVSSAADTPQAVRPQFQIDVKTGNPKPSTGNLVPAVEVPWQDREELLRVLNEAGWSVGRVGRLKLNLARFLLPN